MSCADKKLFYFGNGIKDTKYIATNWAAMDALNYGGMAIKVLLNRDGDAGDSNNQLGWDVGTKNFRSYPNFITQTQDLRAPSWVNTTENFVHMVMTGHDLSFDWYDDSRWEYFVNKCEIGARVARKGRLKGLLIDCEHYQVQMFDYPTMNGRVADSFANYKIQLETRGAELMTAIKAIFPDVQIFLPVAHSWTWVRVSSDGITQDGNLEDSANYGLLPAFLDGFLSVIDSTNKLIDGYETSYAAGSDPGTYQGALTRQTNAKKISDYPTEYQVYYEKGISGWMDYNAAWDAVVHSNNYFTPQEWEDKASLSCQYTDRLYWIYSETPKPFDDSIPDEYIQAQNDGLAIGTYNST